MNNLRFYVDGKWVEPLGTRTLDVIDPASETAFTQIAMGNAADVDRAVEAAGRAFRTFGRTSVDERLALLESVRNVFQRRSEDMAQAISKEIGAPISLARTGQVESAQRILESMIDALRTFPFEERMGDDLIVKEPVGVAGIITPWNWPMQQIVRKISAALAAGCTTVLKPSEVSPINALIFAEVMDEAGVPPGAFNLVNGDGATVGNAITAHPGVDMVSFTGSTRAGIQVAKSAADTVKRVHQELGGKSANIIFPDVDLDDVVTRDVRAMMRNTGQSCNAATRMLVPAELHDEASAIAANAADAIVIGDPSLEATEMGPLASLAQFEKVQRLIRAGIEEGATLAAGGEGRPVNRPGYFARPTIFSNVTPEMTIAREEIFGPVLCIMPYRSEEDAIRIANDSDYGLAAYLSTSDSEAARRVAARLRAGNIHLNGAPAGFGTPFGGFKQSGNGREKGAYGLADFLEVKAVIGAL